MRCPDRTTDVLIWNVLPLSLQSLSNLKKDLKTYLFRLGLRTVSDYWIFLVVMLLFYVSMYFRVI